MLNLKKIAFILLLVLGLVVIMPIAQSQEISPSVNTYTKSVTREVLATGYPENTKGSVLELVRYTIPPQTNLPAHIHPGMQIGKVIEGVLTYTVVQGVANITRSNQSEEIQAGETTLLYPGDSLVEPGGMVHYGKNETDSSVVLLSASLFDAKKPKAILINP